MDWKHAFDAISTALNVVSTAGNMPGINLIPYVSTIATAASAIKTALDVGVKVEPYIVAIKDTFSGDLPSASQLAALDAKIDELRAQVDAPLPPPEEGEPD